MKWYLTGKVVADKGVADKVVADKVVADKVVMDEAPSCGQRTRAYLIPKGKKPT